MVIIGPFSCASAMTSSPEIRHSAVPVIWTGPLRCSRGPNPAVIRGDPQRHLLQHGYVVEIEVAPMQLLDVLARYGEPKRHALLHIAGIDGHKRVVRAFVAGEYEHAAALVALPIVEEEVCSTADMRPLSPDAQQLPYQSDDWLARAVIKIVPAQRPQQRHPALTKIGEKAV